MDTWAPAGRYKVDLQEERLETLTIEAWRQTALTLQVTSAGATEYLEVVSSDLREALLRDGDDDIDPDTPVASPHLRRVLTLRKT
jgi:hypothetical protein